MVGVEVVGRGMRARGLWLAAAAGVEDVTSAGFFCDSMGSNAGCAAAALTSSIPSRGFSSAETIPALLSSGE